MYDNNPFRTQDRLQLSWRGIIIIIIIGAQRTTFEIDKCRPFLRITQSRERHRQVVNHQDL